MSATEEKMRQIRLVAFDVDGVFTDGRLFIGDDGVETKGFHTQDGFGVRNLLAHGFEVAVISGRHSRAVEIRMEQLGVSHVILGSREKEKEFRKLTAKLGLTAEQCAYVGDDVPDLPLLEIAGLSIAVANAVTEVRSVCDLTTVASGGAGAVREVCDMLVRSKVAS